MSGRRAAGADSAAAAAAAHPVHGTAAFLYLQAPSNFHCSIVLSWQSTASWLLTARWLAARCTSALACRRCSAKVVSGQVEQPGGMISEECMEQGYALMCVAFPQSDCKISLIEEVGAGGLVGGWVCGWAGG